MKRRGPPPKSRGNDRRGPPPQRQGNRPHRAPAAYAKPEVFNTNGRWVIGLHSCLETVKVRPHAIEEVLFRPDWAHSEQHREMAGLLKNMEIEIHTRTMEQLAPLGSGHQGVAIRVNEDPELDWDELAKPGQSLILILDGIEDPHNLGSILRTAWLTGVKGILIPEDRAVGLTPTVCKIASGGAEHVAVEQHVNFGSPLEKLKEIGFWIYGLGESGTSRPYDLKLPEKVAWVIGSEGKGLRVSTERLCDELVRLPQVSSGSSYNASIAAAMALAETCRQLGNPQ